MAPAAAAAAAPVAGCCVLLALREAAEVPLCCHCAGHAAEDLAGFEIAVLVTMGELARVAGRQLTSSVPEILPLIIEAVQDGGSPSKRLVAVSTLGQVVESTGTGKPGLHGAGEGSLARAPPRAEPAGALPGR